MQIKKEVSSGCVADNIQNVRMNDRVMSAGMGISDTGVASLFNKGWFPRRNAKFTRSNSLYPSEMKKPRVVVAGFMVDASGNYDCQVKPASTANSRHS